MSRNDRSHRNATHPADLDPMELCEGCPSCDLLARQSILHLEADLERLSLQLWAQGWTPPELLAEIRWATVLAGSSDLLAHLLMADDSRRSDQARPPAWVAEVDQLRAHTGVTDTAIGWLTRWIAANADEQQASRCLAALLDALFELAAARSVA